jgi:hypothetical protein
MGIGFTSPCATVDDAYVAARTATHKKAGIFFGVW